MQETDSKRIEAVKSVYSKLTGTFLNVTPEETDALSSALSSSENINGKIELESFIDHHKLAEAYPGAIPYENYWVRSYPPLIRKALKQETGKTEKHLLC